MINRYQTASFISWSQWSALVLQKSDSDRNEDSDKISKRSFRIFAKDLLLQIAPEYEPESVYEMVRHSLIQQFGTKRVRIYTIDPTSDRLIMQVHAVKDIFLDHFLIYFHHR